MMPASTIKHRSAKSWHKISITIDSRMTEAVAARLADLTGTGFEISSLGNERTSAAHMSPAEKISAYIPIVPNETGKKTASIKIAELRQFLMEVWHFFPECPAPVVHTETIMEEDWGKIWKRFFASFHITPTLTIKPSWEDTEEKEEKSLVIEMDPGLAFGTGHHASTQLALLLLEELCRDEDKKPEKILDVGTGSGILAMACGLFGTKEILALDNDPDAIATAKQNILRNCLEGKISVSDQDVSTVADCFDLVVANITHDILADHAGILTRRVNPGGFLILSGILIGDQEHSIVEIYGNHGLAFNKSLTKDEWAALLFHKKEIEV
jgi:ribosomal protein L11 methyltransferase